MSRQYDQTFVDFPDSLPTKNYYESWGMRYKQIEGFPDYYITDQGDVISFKNEEPRILKTFCNRHGHEYVQLSDRWGFKKKLLVHRLVAEAFLSNDEGYPVVRHLNDNPKDNDVENLAWGTFKDNHNDCVRNGNEYHRSVYCFENDTEYHSGASAARSLGLEKGQICLCCQGKIGHTAGYHFCYVEDKEKCLSNPDWTRDRLLKRVIAISPEGRKYAFNSRKEAAEFSGVSIPSVVNVIAGRVSKAKGWVFKEGEKSGQAY